METGYSEYPGIAPSVGLIGDSRTYFCDWSQYFENTIYNYSYGGITTTGAIRRLKYLEETYPDKVIIAIGVNDRFIHTINIILHNYRTIIEQVQFYTADVYCVEVVNTTWGIEKLHVVNQGIEDLYAELGCTYISMAAVHNPDGTFNDAYDSGDGLHFNESCCDVIAPIYAAEAGLTLK